MSYTARLLVVTLLCAALAAPSTHSFALLIHSHDAHATHTHLIQLKDHGLSDEAHDRLHDRGHHDADLGFLVGASDQTALCADGDALCGGVVISLPDQHWGQTFGKVDSPIKPSLQRLPAVDISSDTILPGRLHLSPHGGDPGGGRWQVIAGILQRSHALLI